MKLTQRSATVAVSAALAFALGPGMAPPSAASHDGECRVGSAPYSTIQSAVEDPACASIRVPKGTYYENVVVARDVVISGAGAGKTVVDGRRLDRVFYVGPAQGPDGQIPSTVTLQAMTITGGAALGSTPPTWNGGGIAVGNSAVTLIDCVVTDSEAANGGGGIHVFLGTLAVSDSAIVGNRAYMGGGIHFQAGGGPAPGPSTAPFEVRVTNSIISANSATVAGGGIATAGLPGMLCGPFVPTLRRFVLKDVRVTQNTAPVGAGMYLDFALLTVDGLTVAENVPDDISTRQTCQ